MSEAAAVYVRGQTPDAANRERDDFYPTPTAGTWALLARERFDGPIWEPACGDGAMARVLEQAGYTVTASDLIDRGYGTPGVDFLLDFSTPATNIVTNPPFKLHLPFIRHALARASGKVAMLGRLAWLEGIERSALFQNTDLARVWVFAGRLTMVRAGDDAGAGGGGMIAFAWFVWDPAHEGPPQLGWVDADAGPV